MNFRAAALLAAGAACARIAPPPGGPPDTAPPILLGTTPDSLERLPGFRDWVEFRFDEIVSEGQQPNFGTGTGSLEQLLVVSPTAEVPVVRWRRDRILVRPREGWRANTVYRIELLAGVRDLRNNESRASTVVTFTTGDSLPSDTLVGRVVDWNARRGAPAALVEAVLLPDSLVYRTTTDSTGRFRFGPLPRGTWLVHGGIDQNRNRRLDPRELFDSVRVRSDRDSVGEIWAFRHDSMPPRIQNIARADSVSATVTFTMMLDPYQRLPVDSVRFRLLPDSSDVPVEAFLPPEAYDSLFRRPAADTAAADTTRADTVAVPARQVVGARPGDAASDTSRAERGPLTSRPALFDRLVLRTGVPLAAGARYLLEVFGIRSVSGVAGSAQGVLAMPRPAPQTPPAEPPDTAAAADTTRAPAR